MKIIFLDIDGVLNVRAGGINSEHVDNLNMITEATDAKIVISSSWRLGFRLQDLRTILSRAGVKAEIIGFTPDLTCVLYETVDKILELHQGKDPAWMDVRGQEVDKWLEDQSVESYVVIDDYPIPRHPQNFLRTNGDIGLTEENAQKIIVILGT